MKDNRGFSLIELVVTMGLMSIIMVLVTSMMTNAARGFELQNSKIELNNESQVIINYLSEAIMEATHFNFVIENESTGEGRYEFFETDPTTGKAIGKGDQRYLYYSGTSLYMVTFNSGEVPPTNPIGSEADNIYLISDEITEFNILPERWKITDDSTDPPTEKFVLKNQINFNITFKMVHNLATSVFEIDTSCRNRIEGMVKIQRPDGTIIHEYEVVNR